MIQQPKTVQFVSCHFEDGFELPKTAVELEKLLSQPECQSGEPDPEMRSKLVHQKQSDRYIRVYSHIQTSPDVQPGLIVTLSAVTTFDKNAKDTINSIFTHIFYPDGQNPELTTYRSTGFKQFDAVIHYPEITEKPIEQ